MSWERLQALAEARRRERSGEILDLAQTIVAGMAGDKDAWTAKQRKLIADTEAGL